MENFEILETLSSNTSRVRRIADRRIFIMKTVSYVGLSKYEKAHIVDTINNLILFNQTNVVRYHNCVVDKEQGTINLLTNYCESGSIHQLIKRYSSNHQQIDEELIWSYITDIALALYDCHNHLPKPIYHGALNTDHVFIDGDVAKIGCFNLGTSKSSSNAEKDLVDLGKILFEMATLSKCDINQHNFNSKLKSCPEGIKELVSKLLALDEEKLSLMDVLQFPEVALKVLEKKLKRETAIYEDEKAKYLEMDGNIARREKKVATSSEL